MRFYNRSNKFGVWKKHFFLIPRRVGDNIVWLEWGWSSKEWNDSFAPLIFKLDEEL